jgi:hypothetical protein
MPCGCKKGSGVSFRGGGFARKKRRKRKKKGGGLIGADPRTWAPRGGGFVSSLLKRRPSQTNRYAGLGGRSSGFRSVSLIGRKRGSGMGFSGAGMAFHGAGLRTGRLFLRRGTGRRMI